MKIHLYRPFRFLLLISLLPILIGAPLIAQSNKPATAIVIDDLTVRLKERLEAYRGRFGFPGAVAGFILSDGREGAVAVGFSDREAKKPMTVRDRLLSGSIGKTYVSAVALQMVGEEKLELDDKISRWLGEKKWFPRLPNGTDITVRMLLNHTSGIPEHVYDPDFGKAVAESPDRVWKPEEIVAYILDADPLFPPGRGWSYADTNYIVLGMILEEITGRPYYEELKQRILEPLGLKDTVPSDRRGIPGLVAGYAGARSPFLNTGKTLHEGKLVINPQVEWTGGGLACTTPDLARWTRAVYQGKAFPDRFMKPYLDGVAAFDGRGERYGLGVQIWNSRHGTCFGHGGWFPGYVSLMAYYKTLSLAVALQLNTDELPNAMVGLRDMLDTLVEEIKKE
jgi:D-alanyl-D-alanine carboxypeptidase